MQKTNIEAKTAKPDDLKAMFEAGVHFGYSRNSRHPSVEKFVYGFRNKTAIIDLEKTTLSLKKAQEFVKSVAQANGQILFVGNKPEARAIIKKTAEGLDVPYVAERWLGGTFTNFKQMRKRVDRLQEIREAEKSGELMRKYKKKERTVIAKEKQDLERYFEGVISMTKLPQVIFVVDPKAEAIAVAEAKQLRVPIIALASSDCDIRDIDYPIVGNDTQAKSIRFFAQEIAKAYTEGRKMAVETNDTKVSK